MSEENNLSRAIQSVNTNAERINEAMDTAGIEDPMNRQVIMHAVKILMFDMFAEGVKVGVETMLEEQSE